jgi:hypothetical protein
LLGAANGNRVTKTPQQGQETHSRALVILIPGALVVVLGVLWFAAFNPLLHYTPGIDSGVYLYIAQQMLRGAAPYRDVFDNKGPVLYLINAVGLILGRNSFWGVYLLEYLLLAGSTVIVWFLVKARTGVLAASALTLFFALEVTRIALGNHEEEYGVVLQAVTLLLLARAPAFEARKWAWFCAGALAGAALFLKPTTLGLWVSVVIACGIVSHINGEWRKWGGRLILGAGGAVVVGVVVLGYLASERAIGAFMDDYLVFNSVYVGGSSLGDRVSSIGHGLGVVGYLVGAMAVVGWLLTLRRVRRTSGALAGADVLAVIAVVWLPVEIALSSTSGYAWQQYYFMWILPITFVLAFAVLELREHINPERRLARFSYTWAPVAILAVALLSLLPASGAALHDLGGSLVHHQEYRSSRSSTERVVDYVRTHTSPNDYVLIWGSHYADINLLADRRSPTRYVMQMVLYRSVWAKRGVPQLLADLKAHPPAMILDSSPTRYSGSAPPIAATNPWSSAPPAVAAAWAKLYAYLHRHYRYKESLDFAPGWPVYVPRGD